MRKFGILFFIVSCFSVTLLAQGGGAMSAGSENAPRATLFGGYSYLRNGSNGFNGWEGQGTFNFNRFLGVTADVSGSSLSSLLFLVSRCFGGHLSAPEQLFIWPDCNRPNRSKRSVRTRIVWRSAFQPGCRCERTDHWRHLHRPHQRERFRNGFRRRS